MSRLRENIAPAVAAVLVIVVAFGVLALLQVAKDRGTQALTDAKVSQVEASASSFNARFSAGLDAVAGLGASGWELRRGSATDQAILDTFAIDAEAQSGFYLINSRDVVTAGILLQPGALGSRFAPPGWEQAKARLATEPAIIMPVTDQALTTEQPSYLFVVAIPGETPNSLRGALVAEQAVTADSQLQAEIAELDGAGTTDRWFLIDDSSAVLASSDGLGLGQPVEDPRYRSTPLGLSEVDSRVVVTADVPALGWRLIFCQDRAEFIQPLSAPLQDVGLTLTLLLLLVGLVLVVVLIRRLREAREQARQLRELNRAHAEFGAVVSHELKTPISGVLGFLQTALDHWPQLSDDDRRQAVRRAATNASRLQTLARDVMDAESLEAGRLGYAFHPVDLVSLLDETVENAEAIDPGREIRLADSDPIDILGDAGRLQQVFTNLLDNAMRNAPAHLPIEVRFDRVGGIEPKVRVSVIDRGPGISPEDREKVFQKYIRASDSAVIGTGLGLYIARHIVAAHKGRIWCDADADNRTVFTVELPLARVGDRAEHLVGG